jgi:single-stranded DNA-binding protein
MQNDLIEIFSGHLGADPYLAYTKKREPVCEMSVGLKNVQNETIWKKIVVFGKLAELWVFVFYSGKQRFLNVLV